MIKKNFATVFTVAGVLIITCMFINIVGFTAQQNTGNNNIHVISAFGG